MYVDELEELVASLRAENHILVEENATLRQEKCCPSCSRVADTSESRVISASVKAEPTSKSAALSPPQKDRVQALLALMMMYYSILCQQTESR